LTHIKATFYFWMLLFLQWRC